MRRALIEGYFRAILETIAGFPFVSTSDLTFDKRSSYIGFIRGEIYFSDESLLHFRELVDLRNAELCSMYVYHHQRADGSLFFRYDNTTHFPDLANYPHHKQAGDEADVVSAEKPTLGKVFEKIGTLLNG
jgi:hypothetical protein